MLLLFVREVWQDGLILIERVGRRSRYLFLPTLYGVAGGDVRTVKFYNFIPSVSGFL